MVQAWYYRESTEDKNLPHNTDPPTYLRLDEISRKTDILYYKIDAENIKESAELKQIVMKHGFNYEDECSINAQMEEFESMTAHFWTEHLHADDEIRLVTRGRAYFDVRDDTDRWIRIEVVPGDLLILPAGIYHRFTLDPQNDICVRRYFQGGPKREAYNRPGADDMAARREYVQRQASKQGQ